MSINDMHVIGGRIWRQDKVEGKNRCLSECYSDTDCVTVAYSTVTEVCQFYMYNLQGFVMNIIPQDDTVFFRGNPNCVVLFSFFLFVMQQNHLRRAVMYQCGLCVRPFVCSMISMPV